MTTLPEATAFHADTIPKEFTVHLGPRSADQIAGLVGILTGLGARVRVLPDGSLLAVRPERKD